MLGAQPSETLYFSKGLPGEASTLAKWLKEQRQTERILQIYRSDAAGFRLASAFNSALSSNGGGLAHSVQLGIAESLNSDSWRKIISDLDPTATVIWLSGTDAEWKNLDLGFDRQVYASGSLLLQTERPFMFPRQLRLAYSHALPSDVGAQIYRARAWLQSRKVRNEHEAVQLDTYFAMCVIENSLMHMAGRFFRDYLIEEIEHETENEPNPGNYPHLGLGPGQRFASKGDYIVEIGPGNRLHRISDWIVP